MVKLYAYFSYFARKRLINYNLRVLEKMFIQGMDKAWLSSEYCPNIDEELGKIALEDVVDDMKEILEHFNILNSKLLEKQYIEIAEQVFKCIPMKMETFYDKFDKECMDKPIFKYYDPYQLFQRISCGSNEDIVMIKEKLMMRAEKADKEVLAPEMENLYRLKGIIDDYRKGKVPSIKLVMLTDFSNELGIILDKFNEEIKIDAIDNEFENVEESVEQNIETSEE